MSHKNKICLKMQAKERFESLKCFGRSKHVDKIEAGRAYDRLQNPTMSRQEYINAAIRDKIYSINTYKTYAKHNNYFLAYCENKGCKTLEQCRPYADEWLQCRIDAGLSAYTLGMERSGLAKLFQEPSTNFKDVPTRARGDITRSRDTAARDYGFSLKNNAPAIDFARATGCRRAEMERVTGHDLKFDKQGEPVLSICGKGGRWRDAPIVGPHKTEIVERLLQAGSKPLFDSVPSHMDVHSYRSDYATAIYTAYARPIEELKGTKFINPKTGKLESSVYYCRGDRKGEAFDKEAMLRASEALGHNRIDVVAGHYIR